MVVTYPHQVLTRSCDPFEPDEDYSDVVQQLTNTLRQIPEGLGLSAPQIGLSKRALVYWDALAIRALVNPVIVSSSTQTSKARERCLSIPGLEIEVERPVTITVDALNLDEPLEVSGLVARVLQHEVDHLEGVLLFDRAPKVMQRSLRKKYRRS